MLNNVDHDKKEAYRKDSNIPRVLSNVQQDEPPVESSYKDGRPSHLTGRAAPNLSWTGGRLAPASSRPFTSSRPPSYDPLVARRKAEARQGELRWQFLYDLKGAYGASRQSWIEWLSIVEQLQHDQRLFHEFYTRLHRNSNGLRWRANCNNQCANNLLESLMVHDPLDPTIV
jgi:hypothetical protein